MHHFIRVWLLACLLVAFISQASAQPSGRANPPSRVGAWAVHPSSGRVFASITESNQVIEYRSDGTVAREFRVGILPTEIVIKRDLLIVGCTKSPSLTVIDLKTNKPLGQIALHGKGPYALFCSQNQNDYAYCICNTGDAWWDGEVFQVELSKLRVRKTAKVQRWRQSHPTHVVMSHDGRWISPDARGASSPSGGSLMEVDEEQLTFLQKHHYHSSFGQKVAGPLGRHWTFGNELYSLDITKKIRTFTGKLVAIHPEYNLVASLGSKQLYFERFSDAKILDQASLDMDGGAQVEGRTTRRSFDPTVAFLKGDLAFVGFADQGLWFDLNKFSVKFEPTVALLGPSHARVQVGEEMKIPLRILNDDPRLSVKIIEGPDTARVSHTALTWTPGLLDVGITPIRLQVQDGQNVLDTKEIELHISVPQLKLGFYPDSMALSPSGDKLLVWGRISKKDERGRPVLPSDSSAPNEIAVVDLPSMKVLVKKTLPKGVRSAIIDDQYVCVSPNSGDLLFRMNHLLAEPKRLFVPTTPVVMGKLGPTELFITSANTSVGLPTIVDLENMTVRRPGKPSNIAFRYSKVSNQIVQLDRRELDHTTGRVVKFLDASLLAAAQVSLPRPTRIGRRSAAEPRKWGRIIGQGGLTSSAGGSLARFQYQGAVMSDDYPIGVLVKQLQQDGEVHWKLDYCDLIEGAIVHSSTVAVDPRGSFVPVSGRQRARPLTTGDKVILMRDDGLIVSSIPKEVLDSPAPPHFKVRQPTEITFGGKQKAQLNIGGMSDDAQLALLSEYPGVSLEATGKLSIDTDLVWRQFVNKELSKPNSSRSAQDAMADRYAAAYQQLTGKALKDDEFPIKLPIAASLIDKEGQRDEIHFCLIMKGPAADVQKKLAEVRELQEKQREQAKAAREAMMAKQRAQSAQAGGDVGKRLDELEAKLRRLEAALDSVLKRLEAAEKE